MRTDFRGELTTESPFVTSRPKHPLDKKNGLKHLPRLPVFEGESIVEKVFVPGSGIKGKLRRVAEEMLREVFVTATGDDRPFDLDTRYLLRIGGTKGQEKDSPVDMIEVSNLRAKNPLLSVFGAMGLHMPGKLAVGHAMAGVSLDDIGVTAGARHDDFTRDVSLLGTLPPAEIQKWKAIKIATAERSEAKRMLRDLKKKVVTVSDPEEKAALNEEIRIIDDNIKGVSIQQPLDGYESIPQGVVMPHRMMLLNATPAEHGFFVAVLERFAGLPMLGAKFAHGCGLFTFHWKVMVDRKEVATIDIDLDHGFRLTDPDGVVAGWLAAWNDLAARATEALIASPPQKKAG